MESSISPQIGNSMAHGVMANKDSTKKKKATGGEKNSLDSRNVFDALSQGIKSTPKGKSITSMSKKTPQQKKKQAVPKFLKDKNNRFYCANCKADDSDDCISCFVCKDVFHATCRKVTGPDPRAICGKTFLESVRPMIAKYKSHGERWGQFMFTCEKCTARITSKRDHELTDTSPNTDKSTNTDKSSNSDKSLSLIHI